MSRREQSRVERRQRVLAAARALIAEGGVEALTMRALAREADLAVNTIYALIGRGRDEILDAIVVDGLGELDRMLREKKIEDPLSLGPTLVTDVVDYVLEHERIYRPLFLAEPYASVRRGAWSRVHAMAMGRDAVQAAVAAGLLRADADLDAMGEHILQSFRSWAQRWAAREIDGPELRARALYGVYLSLVAFATDETRPALRSALQEVERSFERRGSRSGTRRRR